MAQNKQVIFVVDDEPLQCEMLKDHLLSKNPAYIIHTYNTGEDCLKELDKYKPTIVFLDYNLSTQVKTAMDGLQVLAIIKEKYPNTEVVMISGQDRMEVADKAMQGGAFNYIKKGEGALDKAEKDAFHISSLLQKGWDNVTNPERAEIVFANRNKAYGAYELRVGYQRTASSALLIALGLLILAVATPAVIRLLSNSNFGKVEKPIEVTIELKEPPPIDEKEPPPPPPPPPPPTIETVKFTPPVVVDREVEEEQPPPQEKLSETNVGVVTQEGDENATELPPEPVVDPDEGKVFTYVEEMPKFPGGDDAMTIFIQKNTKYPALARENGITGKVYVSFIIDKDGGVKDVKLVRGIGGGCDEEAVRVIKTMPRWSVGKQNGRAVQVQFTVPVNFTLK